SPAEKAGLLAGDKILSIDGKKVTRFSGMGDSVSWNVIRSEGETIPFVVERDGRQIKTDIKPYIAPRTGWRRKSVRQVLIAPAMTPLVEKVVPDSPAAGAGLEHGDIIESVNGRHLYSPVALGPYIEDHPNEPLTLQVRRNDRTFSVTVRP